MDRVQLAAMIDQTLLSPTVGVRQVDRLQLMLSQDLRILHSLVADWAVHLNMELSRGLATQTAAAPEDLNAIRKRVTGGVSYKF